jgi:ATP-dependent Zn protease
MARYTSAYHEAGHAVVGVLLRWAIRDVSVIPDEQTMGRVRHPRRSELDYWLSDEVKSLKDSAPSLTERVAIPPSELTAVQMRMRHRRAHIDIAVRLAGLKAETRFTGTSNVPGGRFDRMEVLDLARQMASEISITANRIILRESARASRLLNENWPLVEAVARALLVHNRLTGREVRAMVKGRSLRKVATTRQR